METANPTNEEELLALMCKALGNTARIRILRYIQTHPGCISNEILVHMPDDGPHAQSTVSQHLRVLRDAGLVEPEGEGHVIAYHIHQQHFGWLQTELASFL